MASVASQYLGPHSPSSKKRHFAESYSNSSQYAVKKPQNSPHPTKFTFKQPTSGLSQPKATTFLTGLENVLKMDQDFVEATKATMDDESNRTVSLSGNLSLANTLLKKRQLADNISSEWGDRVGRPGLDNFTGVLCYRHSLFQALLHIPKFINWLEEHHRAEDCVAENRSDCISCQIRLLSKCYWTEGRRSKQIKSVLKEIHEIFKWLGWTADRANDHGDPDEQLSWMLGIMRFEMTREAFGYFDAFHDLVLESSITCEKCGHVAKTENINERLLSIPIKPRVPSNHLVQYIQKYMIELVSDYRCENESCKHKSDKNRIQRIAYAPDVLMIQLKRFNHSGGKDSQRIAFSQKLSLTPHALDKRVQGDLDYELIASICHMGSAAFGHYICYAKGPNGSWLEFNDLNCYVSDEKEACNPGSTVTPYVLFYERVKQTGQQEGRQPVSQ